MAALRLLQLPESAQQIVLGNMDSLELLALSLCSAKFKTIVKNLNLQIKEVSIDFDNDLIIYTTLPDSSRLQLIFDPIRLDQQHLKFEDDPCPQWWHPKFRFEFWVRHLYSVFNCREITRCWFDWEDDLYDVDFLKRFLSDFTIRTLILMVKLSENNYQLLASGIRAKCLLVHENTYEDPNLLRVILSQNYDVIEAWGFMQRYFAKFDNILSINSSCIKLYACNVSERSVNKYLKLWMKNCIPRIKIFEVTFGNEIDQNAILRGIKHTVIPQTRTRTINFEGPWGLNTWTVSGGYDIRRSDGVEATIHLMAYRFLMIVRNY